MEPIRVLVVDDDADVCALIKYRLTLNGDLGDFSVVTMSDGFDRLGAPGTFLAFDCLVLDLWLTAKGILEEFPMAHKLFKWARSGNPDMPIILFSAVIGLQHRQDIEDDAEVVLAKPSIDQIAGVIKAVTHRRRSEDLPIRGE